MSTAFSVPETAYNARLLFFGIVFSRFVAFERITRATAIQVLRSNTADTFDCFFTIFSSSGDFGFSMQVQIETLAFDSAAKTYCVNSFSWIKLCKLVWCFGCPHDDLWILDWIWLKNSIWQIIESLVFGFIQFWCFQRQNKCFVFFIAMNCFCANQLLAICYFRHQSFPFCGQTLPLTAFQNWSCFFLNWVCPDLLS